MFIHAVYFRLRPDLADAERARFEAGIESLRTIGSVRRSYVAAPAATDRPVIARDYTHALVVVFDDAAGHDAYQVHPVHDRFREECAGYWDGLRIYDAEGPGPA